MFSFGQQAAALFELPEAQTEVTGTAAGLQAETGEGVRASLGVQAQV